MSDQLGHLRVKLARYGYDKKLKLQSFGQFEMQYFILTLWVKS